MPSSRKRKAQTAYEIGREYYEQLERNKKAGAEMAAASAAANFTAASPPRRIVKAKGTPTRKKSPAVATASKKKSSSSPAAKPKAARRKKSKEDESDEVRDSDEDMEENESSSDEETNPAPRKRHRPNPPSPEKKQPSPEKKQRRQSLPVTVPSSSGKGRRSPRASLPAIGTIRRQSAQTREEAVAEAKQYYKSLAQREASPSTTSPRTLRGKPRYNALGSQPPSRRPQPAIQETIQEQEEEDEGAYHDAADAAAKDYHNADAEPDVVVEKDSVNRSAILQAVAGFMLALCLAMMVVTVWETFSISNNSAVSIPSTNLPCFADAPTADVVHEADYWAPHCSSDETERVPCPKRGRCVAGRLVSCSDNDHSNHWRVTDDKTSCVLTNEAKQIIAVTAQLLEKYSIERACGSTQSSSMAKSAARRNPFFVEDDDLTSRPLFSYKGVAQLLETPYDSSLMEEGARNGVLIARRQNDTHELLVGLNPLQPLELPMPCLLRSFVGKLVQWVSFLLWTVLIVVGDWVWKSPLMTVLGCCFMGCLAYSRHKKRRHRLMVLDMVNLKNRVYKELAAQEPGTAEPANLIRDRIVDEDYPDSRVKRKYLKDTIWRAVVRDLEGDHRVHKSLGLMDDNTGDPVLYWEWRDHGRRRHPTVQFAGRGGPQVQ